MKLKQKSDGWRVASGKSSHPAHGTPACHSSLATRHSARGIALIITLILLSVTLIMVVAFMAVARRERNAVSTTTDTATARLATDTALAAAQAQIVADILSPGAGAYNYGLLVSTNYIDPAGYNPNTIGNILPRAPVFIATNQSPLGYDFRYYLDLNRNGQDEANGLVTNVDSSGNPILVNGSPLVSSEVGDPEWIGVLEHPDQPHGANNPFIARYAFAAQPIGNSLDLNAIHNQTATATVNPSPTSFVNDGYFRNEGVGSWELNLAAFFTDLNTNIWGQGYQYNQTNFANSGIAFNDAQSLLSWRYGFNYSSLAAPSPNLYSAFANSPIDSYTLGALMANTVLPSPVIPNNTMPWAGSDNTNRFFSLMSEILDPTKSSQNFVNRLSGTGTNTFGGTTVPTYDRYTFYRMLDELGTDSGADDARMDLNYDNLDANGNVIPGAETNGIAWTAEPGGALKFFTNAANILLQHYTTVWASNSVANGSGGYVPALNPNYVATFNTSVPFGIGAIPVLVSNQFVYTPAVNRLLQLAANMYDATTTSPYPSVFRPMFTAIQDGNYRDLFITGYTDVPSVSGTADSQLATPNDVYVVAYALTVPNSVQNIYGVPWIIGAKKGLPNFNEFYSRNTVQIARKLQFSRTNPLLPGATATNEMFIMSITNHMGFAFWNSYNNDYPRPLTVYLNDSGSMTFSNGVTSTNLPFSVGFPPVTQTVWPSSAWTQSGLAPESQTPTNPASFITAIYDVPMVPESQYRFSTGTFVPISQALWEPGITVPPVLPHFLLSTTNNLQAYILDGNQVIDYVQLRGPNITQDLNNEINDPNDGIGIRHYYMWSTNAYNTSGVIPPTYGVMNQIAISRHPTLPVASPNVVVWRNPNGTPIPLSLQTQEAQFFDAFFTGALVNNRPVTNLVVQAPYTPTRTAWQYTLWEANDPLVHYLASDLNTTTAATDPGHSDDLLTRPIPVISLNSLGDRYQPWGRNQQMAFLGPNQVDTSSYNLRFRDPLVWGSDYWDFPTGKYPTVGWLGRVHRGTPWQTVYLKASDVLQETVTSAFGTGNVGYNTWAQWMGDTQTAFNVQYDAANSAPVADHDLFDLFTVAPNPNATRGTLSVNQTHLAAWSAVFSGLVALTNATPVPASYNAPVITNLVISPAGVDVPDSAVGQIVTAISNTRANFTNTDGVVGTFEHVGDILSVPTLTEQSPFLNTDASTSPYNQANAGISDELYEWLPQQTLGLLRTGGAVRYVVYCYGQTLHPAPDGKVLSSANFGVVTNYQITAESAARAVIRVDNARTATPHVTIESFNPLPPN